MAGTSYDACFDRLLQQYGDILREECARKSRQMPMDELEQTARIGLFYADTYYHPDVDDDYAAHVRRFVRRALDIDVKRHRSSQLCYFSLNRLVPFAGGRPTEMLALLPGPAEDLDYLILYSSMVRRLTGYEKQVAWEMWEGASTQQICAAHGLTPRGLALLRRKMRTIWLQQNGADLP